jgi:fibronectin type 3 domain-containing protein
MAPPCKIETSNAVFLWTPVAHGHRTRRDFSMNSTSPLPGGASIRARAWRGLPVLLAIALAGASAGAQTTNIAYVVPANTAGNQNIPGTSVGLDFDVDNAIVITRLGVFDENSDGLNLPIFARLFNRVDQSVLVSLEFTPEDPGELIGGSRFKALPEPLTLEAGFQGTISADGYGVEERIFNTHGDETLVTWTLNDGQGSIRFVGSSRYGPAGEFPGTADGGPVARFAAGTFEYVTTPAMLPGRPIVSIAPGDQQITLSWPAVLVPAPAARYRVQRGATAAGPFTQLAEITETNYLDDNLVNGTVYCYVVEGVTESGVVGPGSEPRCAAGYVLAANHFVAYLPNAGIAGNQNVAGASIGMDFDVENPILVKRLGAFDDNSDGLLLPITTRIWNRDTLEVVTEVSFTPEEPGELVQGSRLKPLPQPLRLEAGFRGVIEVDGHGAEERIYNSGGDPEDTPWSLHDGNGSILFVGSGRYGGAGVFPDSTDGGPAARYAAGTFEFEALPPEVPGRPRPVVKVPFEDAAVTLSWPAVTQPLPAARYEIARGTSAEGPFTNLGETTDLTYRDTTVQNGNEYFYVVRGVASGGETGPYSGALSARPNPRAGGIAYRVPAGWVGNQDITGASVGMDFDVALPVRITRLGVFDDGGDGLLAPISARLFDRTATDQPRVSLEFTPEDPGELIEGSRFKPLPEPLTLNPGFQGSIVVEGYNTEERLYNTFGQPAVDFQIFDGGSLLFVGRSRYGTAGQFPGTVDTGPVNRFAGGTFEFEPLPFVEAPRLEVTRGTGTLQINWTGDGTLERTDALGGTWQAVAGATSGVEIPTTDAAGYFRLRR